MERFLLFAGETFYASGGWKDFRGSSNSIDDLMMLLIIAIHFPDEEHSEYEWKWWQIVDLQLGEIISESRYSACT